MSTSFQDFPAEIHTLIYKYQSTIADVFHLSYTCRSLHYAFAGKHKEIIQNVARRQFSPYKDALKLDTLLKNPLADYRMSRHKAQKQEKFTKLDPESPHSLFMRMKHNDRVAKFVEFRIDTFIEQGGEDQIDFPRALFNDDRHEYYRIARNRRSRTYAKCQAKERRLMRRLWYRIRMAFHCVEANTLSYIDGVFMDDKFLDFELLGERLWNWFAILFRETRWFFTWKFTDVICEQEEWEDSESERWDDLSDAVIRFLRSQFKDSFEPDHDWNLGGAD